MSVRNRANVVIAAILVAGVIVIAGLAQFTQTGQWVPASWTGGATRADQHDGVVGSDLAAHKR